MSEMMEEAEARGIDRGWDMAMRADAYDGGAAGDSQLITNAIRAAREVYPTDTAQCDGVTVPELRGQFVAGYVNGYSNYFNGQWQDGSPRNVAPRESWKQHALA